MKLRSRIIQFAYIAAAIVLIVAGGLLHGPLRSESSRSELATGNVLENHPELTLLSIAPGGLRAPIVNYLWIRANKLKEEGRYYDAMQLAEMICLLQPRFDGVWAFHAWNMAWNISVATHTPQERWQWVYNGVKLLRDRGIPFNPKSIMLYRELAWIFFSKMGGRIDEMHVQYKARWAKIMQRLLGAPPGDSIRSVIDAFRPIADKRLINRDLRHRGRRAIQAGVLERLLKDEPNLRAYKRRLAEVGVKIDLSLLNAYTRFSMDRAAASVFYRRPIPKEGSPERRIWNVINDADPAATVARNRLLAFVRAQRLWNVYRMDPAWMLHLMEKYKIPIDWRLVWPHGLYWATYGREHARIVDPSGIDALNNDRNTLNCLKELARYGRLSYVENARDLKLHWNLPEELPWNQPRVFEFSDWRFIEPTHLQHIQYAKTAAEHKGVPFNRNQFSAGHKNFLVEGIQTLVASGRLALARKLFRYLKDEYKMTGDEWDLESVEQFALARMQKETGRPRHAVARQQITTALQTAFYRLSLNDMDAFRRNLRYARKVNRIYMYDTGKVPQRMKLPPFDQQAAPVLATMLLQPGAFGYPLTLESRIMMYNALAIEWPRLQVMVYDFVSPTLKQQCADAELNFDKAFPQPSGLKQFRLERSRLLNRPARK